MTDDRIKQKLAGETVGERVKRLRLAKGLSQRDLSEPGVSYAYISRIEAGTREPSAKALRKLAPKLGVTPNMLEFGQEHDPEVRACERQIAKLRRQLTAAQRALERERQRTKALRETLVEELRQSGRAATV